MTAVNVYGGELRTSTETRIPLGYCDSCGKIMVLKPQYASRFRTPGWKCDLGVPDCPHCGWQHHCNSCADYFQFNYDKDWKKK